MAMTGWADTNYEFQYRDVHDNAPQLPQTGVLVLEKRQVGLPSRLEEQELGDPQPRVECFACSFGEFGEAEAMAYGDFVKLRRMLETGVSRVAPVNLVQAIARRYAKIRDKVNSKFLRVGKRPLPEWNEATILEHLRYHNVEPKLQTWLQIDELQEIRKVAANACIVRNSDTGELYVDEKQFKIYAETIKLSETLYKSDVSKKLFYSADTHMDTKAASEGALPASGHALINHWEKKRKQPI